MLCFSCCALWYTCQGQNLNNEEKKRKEKMEKIRKEIKRKEEKDDLNFLTHFRWGRVRKWRDASVQNQNQFGVNYAKQQEDKEAKVTPRDILIVANPLR